MSRKTELQADLKRVGYQLNGAHLTWQRREGTFKAFARAMRELGYGIQAAHQIGGKHLLAYAQHRAMHGVSSRTLANEMSHLRAVLMHIGKEGLARNPAYSNQALGVGRGSRVGTKQPLSNAAIQAFQERMARLGRPGSPPGRRGPRSQSCTTRASNTRSYRAAVPVGTRRWRCYDRPGTGTQDIQQCLLSRRHPESRRSLRLCPRACADLSRSRLQRARGARRDISGPRAWRWPRTLHR